jgi:hypothetical protein
MLPPIQVDKAWCALLLETKLYAEISHSLLGFFLHRDKFSQREEYPKKIEMDTHGIPIYYREYIKNNFESMKHIVAKNSKIAKDEHPPLKKQKQIQTKLNEPYYKRLLPKGSTPRDYLPIIVESFKSEKLGDASRVEILSQEVLGYLILKARIPDIEELYLISPPTTVDLGWHVLITQSKLYAEVCESIGCNHIIHHSDGQKGSAEGRRSRLEETYSKLKAILPEELRSKVTGSAEMGDLVGHFVNRDFSWLLNTIE